jgi:prepilin-type N-terminal cleavage/methylation domain-containing protein
MSRGAGFTLLELLVVLVLLGLASALVGPPTLRSLERARAADELRAVRSAVQLLPLAARRQGSWIRLPEGVDGSLPIEGVPASIALRVRRAWEVSPDGVCTPGELLVTRGRLQRLLRVSAPYCAAEWSDEAW